MELLEKVIAGILIGFITYLYLVPFVHESGHYLYAICNGWEVLEFHVAVPALLEVSYVMVIAPLGASYTFFYMAGSWFTLIIGFFISLIPVFLRKIGQKPYFWIFLSVGYGFMSDSIVYILVDHLYAKCGDWYLVGIIPSIITAGFFFVFLIISIGLNRIIRGFRIKA
jgi:hypothetical protein